jgi:lipopolysaccharide heptosyltransferase I
VVKEILIIRLSAIGDVTLCTPVARSLKLSWPDCKVTWLIGEVSAELIQNNPDIDEIIVWSRERFEKYLREWEFDKARQLWGSLRKTLSARNFYAVLDVHGLLITGLIARLAKTERRIGMNAARELNFLFMTEVAKSLGGHITDRYLGVLAPLGIPFIDHKMVIVVSDKARQFAKNFLADAGISPQRKFAVFIPGTTWPAKNWPPNFFVQLAHLLAKDFAIVLCGGKAEVNLGTEIQGNSGVPVVNAIGKTGLLEMAGMIEQAAVVIAGDTGPLHIAAALEVPTVGIFGPTDPAMHAPLGQEHVVVFSRLACSFCHKVNCRHGNATCMSSSSPEEVASKVYSVARATR